MNKRVVFGFGRCEHYHQQGGFKEGWCSLMK
jgi:hypothetical protein